MTPEMFVILAGDLQRGYTVFGPFESSKLAKVHMDSAEIGDEYYNAEVMPVKLVDPDMWGSWRDDGSL